MIIKNVMLHSAEDLRQFMYQAMQSSEDIGVHTADGQIDFGPDGARLYEACQGCH